MEDCGDGRYTEFINDYFGTTETAKDYDYDWDYDTYDYDWDYDTYDYNSTNSTGACK